MTPEQFNLIVLEQVEDIQKILTTKNRMLLDDGQISLTQKRGLAKLLLFVDELSRTV